MEDHDIVYDIDALLEKIKSFPQTYDTLMKRSFSNVTVHTIMRRKISRLCKEGVVCRCIIPNTRGRKILLYCLPKKQNIIVKAERYGCSVFAFEKHERLGGKKVYIKMKKCMKLNGSKWDSIGDYIVFEGDILKVV